MGNFLALQVSQLIITLKLHLAIQNAVPKIICLFVIAAAAAAAAAAAVLTTWVNVFRIIPEFRILRLTFHRKSTSKC